MFDIKAEKTRLGIQSEKTEFEGHPRANRAKRANPWQKVSTISTFSTPSRSETDYSEIQEATDERAAIIEYDGGLERQEAEAIAALAKDFYNHIMRNNCCYPPSGRYCAKGQELRDRYYRSVN